MATAPRSVGSSEARLGTGAIDLCPEQFPEPDPALVSKVQERSPGLDCIVAPTTHPSTVNSRLSSRRMSRAFLFPTTPAAGYALESKFPLKTRAIASHAPAQIDPSARPCTFVLGTAVGSSQKPLVEIPSTSYAPPRICVQPSFLSRLQPTG